MIVTPSTKAILNSSGLINTKAQSSKDTRMKTTYITDKGNEYPIYKQSGTGKYYIVDKTGKVSYFSNPDAVKLIDQNKSWCISKDSYTTYKNNNTTNNKNTTNTATTGGGSGGGGGGGYTPTYAAPTVIDSAANDAKYQELYNLIQELREQTRPRSAKENAERYGIDYNEQHILDEYNAKTNEYYQGKLDDLAEDRHDYKTNTLMQNNRTIGDYISEYQNAAPTATQRGELAANALAEYMYSNAQLNDYDYSMLQTENNLRKAWDAELADNPNQARQYYNDIGKYLSTLGATQNQADVKQYIDALDAYSQMYAARQSTNSYIANGTAAKYAGLANAAATTASAKANTSNAAQLYNYYLTITGGNAQQASQMYTRNLQNSQGWNENSGGVK